MIVRRRANMFCHLVAGRPSSRRTHAENWIVMIKTCFFTPLFVFHRFLEVLEGLERSGRPVRKLSPGVHQNWSWGQRAMTKKTKLILKIIVLNSFFLIFPFWMPDLLILDLKIGFLIKNCIHRQLERSGIPKIDENTSKSFVWSVFLSITSWG